MEEKEKNPDAQFVVVGKKGVMKLEGLGTPNYLRPMRMSRTAVFMKWLLTSNIFSQEVMDGRRAR